MKIRALITLVIGKNKEILPGNICDVSETEANRLIALGFAEKLNSSVRLILSEPDEITEVGFVNAHSGTHRAKIRISDAPDLKIGNKIGMDGKIYAVRSEPVKDIHNLIWSCDLVCV